MFQNAEQSLFTTAALPTGNRVGQRQGLEMKTRPNMAVASTGVRASAGGTSQLKMMAMGGAPVPGTQNVSQSKASTGFGFSQAARGPNAYSEAASAANRQPARLNLGVKMSAASSSSFGGAQPSRSAFMSNRGMPLASKPAARAGGAPMMSMDFNVEGAQSNAIIENYQDASMGAAKRAPSMGGWGRPQQKAASRTSTILMAVPEGSWGDVKRAPVVGGNWKSNGDMDFVNSFPKDVLNKSEFDKSKMSVCVAPTDIHLSSVNSIVNDGINVMAQDVSQYPKGAYTGNVTSDQLKDIGVMWTLTGHSERRTLSKESDEDVAKKTKAAVENGVTVMACIGEQLEEREGGKTDEVNARQLKAIADELTESQWGDVVIAYEPVWAIGTGKVATPEQAEETHLQIRDWLAKNISPEVAGATRILYGGSVNAGNCSELIEKPNIDGFLVGGASLKEDFKTIIETVAKSI